MSGIDARELFSAAALENPYPLYARMRAAGPVCELRGTRAFWVGGYAAVEEALARHEVFSANLTGVLVCGDDGAPRVFDLGGSGTADAVIATADEPAHAVQRRLLMPPLKAARIAALEPAIRAFARERIEHFVATGGGDWCDALAEPLPAWVITRLLGLEASDMPAVRRWAMMGGDLLAGRVDAADMQRLLRETAHMTAFLAEHFARVCASAHGAARRREGGTVVDESPVSPEDHGLDLGRTLADGMQAGLVSREQAIGILVILFGAAGESTAALAGSALKLLLETPGVQETLRARPALIPAFVEEAVRLESPFKFHYRVVRQDTVLCGTSLRAGDRLLLGWASANRDAGVIGDPDTLRLDRPASPRHLGFGHGIHFCIGAPLARLEVRVALEELLARSVYVEAAGSAAWVPSIFVRRLRHLPVRVRGAAGA